jgi:hypothetical protein
VVTPVGSAESGFGEAKATEVHKFSIAVAIQIATARRRIGFEIIKLVILPMPVSRAITTEYFRMYAPLVFEIGKLQTAPSGLEPKTYAGTEVEVMCGLGWNTNDHQVRSGKAA